MKCESCDVQIKSEFVFAIQTNQCPACGKQIMQSDRLASFLSLKSLLGSSVKDKDIDLDRLASIIVANFELKQIFKEDFKNSEKESIIKSDNESSKKENREVEKIEDDVGDPVFDEDGIKYEKVDKKKAKDMLQKMRDAALSEALNDRDVDITNEDMILLSDDSARQEYKLQAKREEARKAMMSGTASVRRSSQ